MEIRRKTSRELIQGPKEYFTGTVTIDPLFMDVQNPARVTGASVSFEAGARTAWHTHPLGQTLIITKGSGLVQLEGKAIEEINVGDVVRIAPGERHWHGAKPNIAMTHMAIQEELDGSAISWKEHVSDKEYKG